MNELTHARRMDADGIFQGCVLFWFFFLFPQLTCFKIMKKLLKVHFFPLRVT